tara:strand:+ start:9951 stop:10652 length:702 start_codon:yes stop_codon:yes gene_type:complete
MIEFLELAKECAPDVHVSTIMAIVRHESGFDPLAIGVNAKPHRSIKPKTREEAIQAVQDLLDAGKSFDAGYGQINNANWKWLGITPENVFDPCTNLKAAQRVLLQCYEGAQKKYQGQAALHAALSCYNTGNYTYGFKNGYVAKVLSGAGLKVPALKQIPQKRPSNIGKKPISDKPVQSKTPEQNKDALNQPMPDVFTESRPDVFTQPRPGIFRVGLPTRNVVGSIIYNTGHTP